MSARRVASRVLLVFGLALVGVGLVALAAFRLGLVRLEGIEDLGLVVGAMLLGGLGGGLCAAGLLLAPPGGLSRAQLLLGAAGCLPALLAGAAFVSAGAPGPRVFGLLVALLALAGLLAAGRLLLRPRQRAL